MELLPELETSQATLVGGEYSQHLCTTLALQSKA